ncbi:uncharacterized protein TNCV_2994342 [Trichonephila clavipes]|nr:uncharacterized protein TNCV_2994342 [Trichonephila clavipes]
MADLDKVRRAMISEKDVFHVSTTAAIPTAKSFLVSDMEIEEAMETLKFTCRNCGGGDRGRVAIYRPFGEVSLSLNRTVTCMVLKANDRRTSCPCHDEFRGPRSDYVRQVALATTQQQHKRQRIDEADISTLVAVDQRTAWRKLYDDSPPCGVGVDRRALNVTCQFFELFGTRRSTASKFTSLWNCSTTHELLLRGRKIFLLEGR